MNDNLTDLTAASSGDDGFVAWLSALTETNNLSGQVGIPDAVLVRNRCTSFGCALIIPALPDMLSVS